MTFTPTVIGSGISGYSYLTQTRANQQETLANTQQNLREADELREGLASISSSEDLMNDPMMLRIALGAFGLDEDINNRAFIQQVLDSDVEDSTSFANRLTDTRYASLARAFGFNSDEGAQIPGVQEADELAARLENVNSVQDLLEDRDLLRTTLRAFDLPDSDANNTYFLEQVLNSDVDDASSFANSLMDERYANMAATLDFASKDPSDSLTGFAKLVASADTPIENTEDLIANRDVLNAALDLFDLNEFTLKDDFVRDVLNSDLEDENSFANGQSNDLWVSFSKAFGFGERLARPDSFLAQNTKFDALVEAYSERDAPFESAQDFRLDLSASLAAVQFFDIPSVENLYDRVENVLESDRGDPNALVNLLSDDRYRLLADSINIQPAVEETWSPPEGFSDAIMEAYLERQFETLIGESDPTMRIALAFEREFESVIANGSTNDVRWFNVMASEPVRAVIEAAFGLPDSFGSLDVDQQLVEFKARSQARMGTDQVTELADPDLRDTMVQRYLAAASVSNGSTISTSSAASVILASIQSSIGL